MLGVDSRRSSIRSMIQLVELWISKDVNKPSTLIPLLGAGDPFKAITDRALHHTDPLSLAMRPAVLLASEYWPEESRQRFNIWASEKYKIINDEVTGRENSKVITKFICINEKDEGDFSFQERSDIFTKSSLMKKLCGFLVDPTIAWAKDYVCHRKALAMCAFSELSYLRLEEDEVASQGRFKVWNGSDESRELARLRIRFSPVSRFRTAEDEEITFRFKRFGNFVFAVARSPLVTIVAIRGTQLLSPADLITDFRFRKSVGVNSGFHSGFVDAAEDGIPWLLNVVPRDQPVYLTGHSLGAAVAAVVSFCWEGPTKIMQPYLFAPPRFAVASRALKVPRFSYVVADDPVPSLPPRIFGYSDVGDERMVLKATKSISLLGKLRHFAGRLVLVPHRIRVYRSRVAELAEVSINDRELVDTILDAYNSRKRGR